MTPAWENFKPGTHSLLKWLATTFGTSNTVNFTIGMAAVCALPAFLYWVSCIVGARWGSDHDVSWRTLFVNYAFSLLPIALFYHLAHNAMHLFAEGGHLITKLGDPMGTGANYFGLADIHPGALLGETTLWYLQVGLILIGHLFGIVVAHRMGNLLYDNKKDARRSLVPMLAMMVLISIAGLGLMHLDMNMRIGRM